MAKRKILKLIPYPVNITIIGISSHENDYRISWSINEKLGLAFSTKESLTINPKKKFTCFVHQDEDKTLMLVSNICENGFLLDKYKNIDFILKFDNQLDESEINKWIQNLRETPIISAAFNIPVNKQIQNIFS